MPAGFRRFAALVGLVFAVAVPNGCVCSYLGPRLEPPTLPKDPKPLPDVNTESDDFNSAARYSEVNVELVFSSNRASANKSFDLWRSFLRFEGDSVRASPPVPFAEKAMSRWNELGPLFLGPASLVFASDRPGGAGKLDLYRAALDADASSALLEALTGLNSAANDAYLATYESAPFALFASDRNGNYDIFEVSPREEIFSADARPRVVEALSSPADDTAPFLFEYTPPLVERDDAVSLNPPPHPKRRTPEASVPRPYVVFASRRAGSRGGFDLYCSRWVSDHWESPRALERLNSPSDEFRPIVVSLPDGGSEVVIFSSNRPGGLGGFDLYYARFQDPFED